MRRRLLLAAAPVLLVPLLLPAPAGAGPAAGPPAAPAGLTPSALIPTTVTGFPGKAVTVAPGKTWTAKVTVSGPAGRLVQLQRLSSGRWVPAKSVRTSARKVAAFTVAQAKAGTFRYRVVVPRIGLFAARTTAAKVVTVKAADLRSVPQVISGSFSGADDLASWQGTVELTSTGGTVWSGVAAFGVAWTYKVTKLTGSWSWKGPLPGVCTRSGGGTISLPDVAVDQVFDATGLHTISATHYFDPWASKGKGPVYDFRMRFANDVVWPYTDSCPDPYGGAPDVTNGNGFPPFLALATADGISVVTGLSGPVPTSDGSTFAGTVLSNYQGTTFTWNLTGDLLFPRARPGS